jgi:hypothetical protein
VADGFTAPPPCVRNPLGPPRTATMYCEPGFQRLVWMDGLVASGCFLLRMNRVP